PAGDEEAAEERDVPFAPDGADVRALQMRGVVRRRETEQEKRDERQKIAPTQPAALPPEDQQNRRRQRTGHRLAQERADKKEEREEISLARRSCAIAGRSARFNRFLPALIDQRRHVDVHRQ